MTHAAASSIVPPSSLPLVLQLTRPEAFDESPLEAVERESAVRALAYDPVRQVGRGYDITMGSTKSPGICCVFVGGVDVSSRDTVNDD